MTGYVHRASHRLTAIDVLLEGVVDYAGLFPPAGEEMRSALENYSSYLGDSDRAALGRFIVPVSRLEELERVGGDLMPRGRGADPWRLAALISGEATAEIQAIVDFNHRRASGPPAGAAVIDVVELKASSAPEIVSQRRVIPDLITPYFEIPISDDVTCLIAAIAAAGARAKIRTGGITADAFPSAETIVDFLAACKRAGVAFKATAGLHHPLRGEYRLTYEAGSQKATMYGFLNVFLAAALVHAGQPRDLALAVLRETDRASLGFDDDAIIWRDRRITSEQLRASREFAISFGSCSFREPIDEIAQLTRTAKPAQL